MSLLLGTAGIVKFVLLFPWVSCFGENVYELINVQARAARCRMANAMIIMIIIVVLFTPALL